MKRTMMAALTVAALTAATAGAQQAPANERTLTLAEAVRLAQANSPATVASRNALSTGASGVRSALAQFLPQIGLSAGASRSGGETFFQGKLVPYSGDAWSYGKGYFANLTLFDGGQRWLGYRAAAANLDAADASDVSQRFNVAQNVKVQYFAVLAARESESAAERQMQQASQQLEIAVARVQAGAAFRVDSIRSAILVVNARLAMLAARNALRTANASLTRLVGSNVPVTAVVADTADVSRIDVDSTQLALLAEHGPAVRAAEATALANRENRRSVLTQYLPTLQMSYSFRASNTSPQFTCCGGPTSSSNSLSFGVSYNIFDGLRRENTLSLALAQESNSDANVRDAKLAARESLEQFLSLYQTARESIELQMLNIAAAEDDLSAQQHRYALGASALLDVLNSQTQLETARAALVSARFQARTAKAQIETLLGRDLP